MEKQQLAIAFGPIVAALALGGSLWSIPVALVQPAANLELLTPILLVATTDNSMQEWNKRFLPEKAATLQPKIEQPLARVT